MLKKLCRYIRLLSLAAAFAVPLSGVYTAKAQDNLDIVRYANGTDVQTLDPQFVGELASVRMALQIHEPLVYPDSEGKMVGVLAESWTRSDDDRSWTFHLKKGITFQDGAKFNADAVKYTFERLVSPETGSPRASTMAAVEKIDVIDEYTVRFTTKKPFAPLLAQLSAYSSLIISPNAGKALNAEYSKAPAGTGPFKLGSWRPGDRMVLERNDNYWGEKPKVKEVHHLFVPEDSSRVLMLLSGEADIVSNVPPAMIPRLESTPTVDMVRKVGVRTIYVGFNTKMKPFDDKRVREAIAAGIDTKALISGVMNNFVTPGGGLESPAIIGSADIPPYPFDLEKAKRLLAEAGYPDGFDVEFYVPSGRYINDRQLGEAIQGQLTKLGINATIRTAEFGTYLSMLAKKDQIPFFLLSKGGPTGDADFNLTINAHSKGSVNYFNYNNPEVDALIDEQRTVMDPEKRNQVTAAALKKIYDDYPFIVLFYENQLFGKAKNVEGFDLRPNEGLFFKAVSKK